MGDSMFVQRVGGVARGLRSLDDLLGRGPECSVGGSLFRARSASDAAVKKGAARFKARLADVCVNQSFLV